MELLNSFKLHIIFFIACEMLLECLPQSTGMCWDEYRAQIDKTNHQDNVLYICTNSQLSNKTDTVYMDMVKVPRFENSTCYCTVTFTNENEGDVYSVNLDYKIKSSTDALSVNGYGADRFSTMDTAHVVETTLKVNDITFTLTSPESDFKSCLRITSEPGFGKSLFRVKCFTNRLTPVTSSSANTWTTPTSTSSYESTIETGLGSTLSQITETSTGLENNGPSGAVIGGAVIGGVFLIIVTVIALLVLKRRKTKTDQRKDDDRYINEIGLNHVGNVTTDSANEGTYKTPLANSVDENKYETLTANSADGTNYETLVSNSVDENKYEALTVNSADGTNYKTPVVRSTDDYKYENIAGQSTDESKYENVTENDNFSSKSTNNKAYVNEDVILSIKK